MIHYVGVYVSSVSYLIMMLFLPSRGLRCSWDSLALLDAILPVLLVELERQISSKTTQELRLVPDNQRSPTFV